jgi:hypothetical protein
MKNKLMVIVAVCAAILMMSSLSMAQLKICTEDGSIKRVTKSAAGKYETVTFEVLYDSPKYNVSNAKRPFSEYGSEKRLRIRGKQFKSIVFTGVNWTCKIGEKLSAKTSNITAVKSIEQFEGQVEYIIGYNRKGSYVGETSTRFGKGRKIVLKFKR